MTILLTTLHQNGVVSPKANIVVKEKPIPLTTLHQNGVVNSKTNIVVKETCNSLTTIYIVVHYVR